MLALFSNQLYAQRERADPLWALRRQASLSSASVFGVDSVLQPMAAGGVPMFRWLSFVLAVPALGLAATLAAEARLTNELRNGLHEAMPELAAETLSRVSPMSVCSRLPDFQPQFCELVWRLKAVEVAAGFSIVVPLLLSAGISQAGRIARGRRERLASLFVPGFYATALLLTLLVILHAAIAVLTIWHVGIVFTGRIIPFMMLAIALGGLTAFIANVSSIISVLRPATIVVSGIPVTDSQSPGVWKIAREVAARLGTAPPENIVLGTEPNFYVIDTPAVSLVGPLRGRTLFCSTSLCRILTHEEFKAVIGHELAHFAGADLEFSRRFAPIYHGVAHALHNMSGSGERNFFLNLAQLPARAIYSYLLFSFATAEREIARARELEADRSGAAVTSVHAVATTLTKLHAFECLWSDVQDEIGEAIGGDSPVTNESELFAHWVREYATPGALEGLASRHTSHPIDTHPLLGERLVSLGVTLEQVADVTLALKPEGSAIELVNDHEALEVAITEAHRYQRVSLMRRAAPANDTKRDAA